MNDIFIMYKKKKEKEFKCTSRMLSIICFYMIHLLQSCKTYKSMMKPNKVVSTASQPVHVFDKVSMGVVSFNYQFV